MFSAKAASTSPQCRCGEAKQSKTKEIKNIKDTRIVGGSDVSPVSNESIESTRTSGRYRALVLVPRFARQKVFISISYFTFIVCFIYISMLTYTV